MADASYEIDINMNNQKVKNLASPTDDNDAARKVDVGVGGEINTASNTGTSGTGVFKQKTGFDLEFYKLNSVNNKITVALDGTDKVDLTLNEGNIDHAQLTNTHNLTTDIDHNTITNNHNLTTDIDHNTITNNHNLTTDIDHDTLTNFSANEHLDWTADLGATNINPANYTDNDTTYISSDFTHDDLTGFEANEHLDWTISQAPTVIHADNYTDTDTTYTSSDFDHNSLTNTHNLTTDIDHDALTNFSADEHFLQGAISIPASQISDFDTEVSNNTDVDANTSARHTQNTDSDLDATFEATFVKKTDTVNVLSDITSAGADIEDAVTKKHTAGSDTSLGSGCVAADHGTAATDQIINVCYGTGEPPDANTTTIGTLFVKYTA